ncbi:hypothetical protein MTBBW1_1140005 [Desulfamplus magnetovallimortis]|uniref:DUF1638 domain-containing protein n=1 Tax=Desulfamplus magnetovallimortis TaxID=1246637 RepID=A0A1W1H607_9BACT|nr:DUF1638 domain-containing protein [Desulfamplus magnetovallimortis]SLM27815.1 hypothetical protein MTBBW1_1140005 [Desulfamplus magnetovallimortis]
MKQATSIHIIACGVLAPDIKKISEQLDLFVKTNFLPGGLHNNPVELKKRLQNAIDSAAKDNSCSRIVVGYGICGMGSVGIKAPKHIPLVFPRVHDCIALFMGSDLAYKREFERYPGTFYLSAGWYGEKKRPRKGEKDRQIWIGSQSLGCRDLKKNMARMGVTE